MLSPAVEDGKNLSDEQLRDLCQSFIKQTLGIDPQTQPYYMRVHEETRHKHVHIYLPRTNAQGKTISDKLCQYRAMDVADRLAQEYSLTRAMEIQKKNEYQLVQDKKTLKEQINRILPKCKSFTDFKEQSKKVGIEVMETINKQGQFQGYRLQFGTMNLKASELDRNLTLPKLDVLFKENALRLADSLTRTIGRSFSKGRDGGIGY